MDIAQSMTPTLFGRWARQSVSTGSEGDLNVMASLQACLLQGDARKNGDPDQGSLNIRHRVR
jgi:hypothetical protein